MTKSAKALTRERMIEEVLTFWSLGEKVAENIPLGFAVPPDYFDDAVPMSADIDFNMTSSGPEVKLWHAYTPKLLKRDWDTTMIVVGDEDWPEHYAGLSRFRRIPVARLRGSRLLSNHVAELSHMIITRKGEIVNRIKSFWQYGNHRWLQVPVRNHLVDQNEPEWATQFKMGVHLQLHQYADHQWHVSLGYEGMPMLKLSTDPEGARAAFRLRDLPEGRQRRAALRHWVTEHWRSRPHTDDKAILVGEYLRGAEKFRWNGLNCVIAPSLADLHQAYPDRFGEPEALPDITTPPVL